MVLIKACIEYGRPKALPCNPYYIRFISALEGRNLGLHVFYNAVKWKSLSIILIITLIQSKYDFCFWDLPSPSPQT
jgi:hypothetical protein